MNYLKRLNFIQITIIILLSSFKISIAQLIVTPATTNGMATALVGNVLIGKGVTFSNVSWNGQFHNNVVPIGGQIGSFTTGPNPTNLGITNGIIMSTGDVLKAPLPNNKTNYLNYTDYFCTCEANNGDAKCFKNLAGCQHADANLETLQGCSSCTFDATDLQFDFTPISNQISFRYVFASDEYPDWVCSPTNDIFGFFVSGNKPGGGNYLSQNIALIPVVNEPVSINTVNIGKCGKGYNPGAGVDLANSQFYVNNINGMTIVYNAFTTVFTAKLDVIPCNTYHIKLAIADVGDGTFDSSVFIEAKSFSISTLTVTYQNPAINDTAAVRGCSDAIITIKTPNGSKVLNDSVVQINFTGTAVYGTDYITIPANIKTSITIPQGESSVSFNIHPLCTASQPGPLNVNLNLFSCSIVSTFPIKIISYPQITATPKPDTTVCIGETAKLSLSNITGGIGAPYSYSWSSNPAGLNSTAANLTVNPTITTTYTVKIDDGCGTCSSNTYNMVVNVVNLSLTISAIGPVTFCTGDNVILSISNQQSGVNYQWQKDGIDIGGATESTYSAIVSGNYTLTISKGIMCKATSQVITVTVNPLPDALITPQGVTSFCKGGSVVLNANTEAGLKYQWQNNGTDISGATESSYTASISGNYNVIVTNINNCTSTSQEIAVSVYPIPIATITPQGPTTFCEGENVILASGNQPAGSSYQWQNNGADIGGATTSAFSISTAGTYTVIITNNDNCTTTSDVATVIVYSLPQAIITPQGLTTFCDGGSVILNANTDIGFKYQWRKNGINIAGATISSYTVNASGSYSVMIINSNNCSKLSNEEIVTVNPMPSGTILPQGETTFCQGDNVVLNVSTNTGINFQWLKNGSNIAGETTSSFKAEDAGIYEVIITNASNCTITSDDITITISKPTAIINVVGLPSFCKGNSTFLTANKISDYTYQWEKDGNPIPGATDTSLKVDSAGNYSFVMTKGDYCKAISTMQKIIVNPSPIPSIEPPGPFTICSDSAITLIANLKAGLSYQWQLDGSNIDGATSNIFTLTKVGLYTVVETDNIGCFGKRSVIANLHCPPLSIYVPNAFTPSDPSLNKIFYAIGYNITNYKIDIYNKWGTLVFHSDNIDKGWDGKYNNSDCPYGVYIYIIHYEGIINNYTVKKIKKGLITLLR